MSASSTTRRDTFEAASAVDRKDAGRYVANIPDGWQQGRGAFGGLAIGVLTRAMLAEEPDPKRTLRALNAEICGPVAVGSSVIAVSTLRHGNNVSNLEARLTQNATSTEVLARASAVLGAARNVELACPKPTAPKAKPWNEIDVAPIAPPIAPVFTPHYEYRSISGYPFMGGKEMVCEGYIRENEPASRLTAPSVIGLLDAWWPAIAMIVERRRPCATVTFTAQIVRGLEDIPADARFYYRARVLGYHQGFSAEVRELWWGEDLVALNQQTFVVVK